MALANIFKKSNPDSKLTKPVVDNATTPTTKATEAPTPIGAAGAFSYAVLEAPHITEKAARLEGMGQYIFRVNGQANKIQVRQAVEAAYKVKVAAVHLVRIPAKARRLGQHSGFKSGYKKAIVSLLPGQRLELMPK